MEDELDLSNSQIDNNKLINFSKVLAIDKNIKSLNLSDNLFDDIGIKALSNALKQNKTLEILNINFNNIQESGYKDLAKALGQNKHLRLLYAITSGDYAISLDVVEEFVKYLRNNTTLIVLKLEQIYNFSEIEMILERNRDLDWKNIKKVISDVAITLYPLNIPPYVIMEIIDQMGYSEIPEIKKIAMIQKVEKFLKL